MFRRVLILAALVLGCGVSVSAQGYRIGDAQAVTSSLTSTSPITPLQASVNVCVNPANAVPCTNKASTFTSVTLATPCSAATQVVLAGTTTCVTQTDARGNWGAWVAAGNYDVTFTLSTGQSFGPYTISVGIPAGTNISPGTVTATTLFGCIQNNVLYVGDGCTATFTGSDIGAQVNSAYGSASCGTQGCTIRVLQRASGTACYPFSTPIVFGTSGKFIRFEADVSSSSGANQGACLNYTPTTATSAITINADNGNQKTGWGIYGLQLLNNGGCTTVGGCGSSATGITITHGSFVEIANTQINGFGTAIAPNLTGPFGMKFRDLNISNNTNGAGTGTTAYENLFFERGIWQQNGTAFNFGNAGAGGLTEIKIKDISCDDNLTCVNIANQTGLNSFIFDNLHHENVLLAAPTYLIAGTGTNVTYLGGGFYDDTTTAQTQMVSSAGSTLAVYGTHLKKNSGAMTQVFNLTSPVRTWLQPINDTQNVLTTLTGGTSTNINSLSLNGINGGGVSPWHFAEAPLFYEGAVPWGSIPNDPITFTQGVKECLANGNYCIGNGNNTFQMEVGTWFQVGPALFANNASTTTPDSVGGTALMASPGGLVGKEGTCPVVAGTTWDQFCADSTLHAFKSSLNGNAFLQVPQVITATSAAFATATTAGTCVQNTTAVTGAATTMAVSVSPVSTPGVGAVWSAFVSSAGNVTINECAVATSAGGTIAFNIRVTP